VEHIVLVRLPGLAYEPASTWDMPRHISVLLLMFLAVIVFGVLRAAVDRSYIESYPLKSLISEELINTVKWVLPGLLLFDGCRTRNRAVLALACLLIMYFLMGAMVVRNMPPSAAFSGGYSMKNARSKLDEKLGYQATDLSVLLGGTCWGLFAALPLIRRKDGRIAVLAAAGIVTFGQATTGGRAGYIAWAATGLILCLMKWRKYLILAPLIVLLLPVVFPGAAERMLQGFGQSDVTGETVVDTGAVTSNRMLIWPYVIEEIGQSPIIGYGRLAMRRTGLMAYLLQQFSDPFPHPHNMYLEMLLDNGIVGSIPILLLWAMVVWYSGRLFRSANRLYSAVGGLSLALVLTSLIGGLSGQHYFPQEHTLGVWAAVFLSLRVYVEETRVQMGVIDTGEYGPPPVLEQQAAVGSV
jgi:O-antigen ligase